MSQETGLNILHQKLKTVSERAGVYRMIDAKGTVLYVGKAKNLKKRLTNYTHLERLSARIRQMVSEIADLITIETAGEAEALILENNLIKEYRPFYNILLKDDKSYPYILLTREDVPRLVKYRGNRKTPGDYFGPFTSGLMVQKTLKELQKIFGLRTCNNTYFSNRTRPCLLAQIGRCSAPCTGKISANDYAKRVQQTLAFLRGESIPLQAELEAQMRTLSHQEKYEEAAFVRDKLLALNQIQNTDSETPLWQTDIVAIYRAGDSACIQVFFYRSGHAEGNVVHFLNNLSDSDDALATFLMQFYDQIPPPKQILISEEVAPGVALALSERAGFTVSIDTPRRGDKKKLIDGALENARQSYRQRVQEAHIRKETCAPG